MVFERIWSLLVDAVSAAALLMVTAIGAISPAWTQVLIVALLVLVLAMRRVLRGRSVPAGQPHLAQTASEGFWDPECLDGTLMAAFDAEGGVFDAGNRSPGYAAAYAAARPIEKAGSAMEEEL